MKSPYFIAVFIFVYLLNACSQLSDKKVLLLLRAKNALEQSTENIQYQSDNELAAFHEKTCYPPTAAKSFLFYPIAKLSASQIDSFTRSIKDLKIKLLQSADYPIGIQTKEFDKHFFKKKHQKCLNKSTVKEAFQRISTTYPQLLEKLRKNFTLGFDSTNKPFYTFLKEDGDALIDKYTSKIVLSSFSSLLEAEIELAIIENNIASLKSDYILHCNQYLTGRIGPDYECFAAICSSNKSVFVANEKIEIYAAVGSFIESVKPKYKINNRVIQSIDGLATYQTKVASSIGEHCIPVEIIYSKADGTSDTTKRDIIYRVVDTICSH